MASGSVIAMLPSDIRIEGTFTDIVVCAVVVFSVAYFSPSGRYWLRRNIVVPSYVENNLKSCGLLSEDNNLII